MSHVEKRLLKPGRRRVVPDEGFSWIDRRFVRDGFTESLTGAEILLYFFLCSVADQDGLSFYGDRRIGRTLRLEETALDRARRGLIRKNLVAYQAPLYQVLSLPEHPVDQELEGLTVKGSLPPPRMSPDDVRSVGQILNGLDLR